MRVKFSIEYDEGETSGVVWDTSKPTDAVAVFHSHESGEDVLEDTIDELPRLLRLLVEEFPENVRPYVVTDTVRALEVISDVASGIDHWSEMLPAEVGQSLNHEFIAELLMNLLGDPERAGRATKMLALDVAEHMGPDWAQALYRFAVMVTRFA